MNNVMTNCFCELTTNEWSNINGGWPITVDLVIVQVTIDSNDVNTAANWYKNTYVPAAENFGAKVYDYLH